MTPEIVSIIASGALVSTMLFAALAATFRACAIAFEDPTRRPTWPPTLPPPAVHYTPEELAQLDPRLRP